MFDKKKAASASINEPANASLKRGLMRAAPQPEPPKMFEKILIANRGDQPPTGGAAAQPNSVAAASRVCDFNAETTHV